MMDFDYVPSNVPGPGSSAVDFIDDIQGCKCLHNCYASTGCTCLQYGSDNYDSNGRLIHRIDSQLPIIECSDNCDCALNPIACINRQCQFGIRYRLEVFDAADKGFGLRTLDRITNGTFVCEYAGEIIDADEVMRRDHQRRHCITSQSHNYVLTVKEHFNGMIYVSNTQSIISSDRVKITYIDPSMRGNLARFINHSCSASNLRLTVIRYGSRIPHVGLFAVEDIEPMQELSYDYGQDVSSIIGNVDAKRCRCASINCRQWLPHSATAIS